MAAIFYLLYLVIGIAQFFAIWDALGLYLGWGFVDLFVALFVTYIPLLGSILGYLGATNVWGWEPIQALALFFWYLPVVLLVMLYSAVAKK